MLFLLWCCWRTLFYPYECTQSNHKHKFVKADDETILQVVRASHYQADDLYLLKNAPGHRNIVTKISERFTGFYAYIQIPAYEGSLKELLVRRGGAIDIDATIKIVCDVLNGLQHLNNARMVHRGLEPDAIVLSTMDPTAPDFKAMIRDAGTGRAIGGMLTTVLDEKLYVVPEAAPAEHNCDDDAMEAEYNFSVDTWSFGVIIFEMINGVGTAFSQDGDEEEAVQANRRAGLLDFSLDRWQGLDELKNLVQSMVNINADERMPFDELIARFKVFMEQREAAAQGVAH